MSMQETEKKPYLSIKWQAFGLTSLILGALCVSLYLFLTTATQKHFQSNRDQIFQQDKQQFNALIEISGQRVTQLAHFSAQNTDLGQVIMSGDASQLGKLADDLSWTLQVEYGIDHLIIYDRDANVLESTEIAANNDIAQRMLRDEQGYWDVQCPAHCYIQGGTPILNDGEIVGALVVKEPLSHLLLRYEQISNLNTALLSEGYDRFFYVEHIKEWNKKLVSLTNPLNTRPILDLAIAQYSLDNLSQGSSLVEHENQVHEFRAFNIQGNTILVIANVTSDREMLSTTRRRALTVLGLAFAISELLLLLVLWKPMNRIQSTSSVLPMLAAKQYALARSKLSMLGKRRLVRDETDRLSVAAITLSRKLEEMQGQLEKRASELEKRGNDLLRERDFVNQLFNTMHAIIIIQDSDGYIRQANDFALTVTGLGNETMVGSHFAKLLDPGEDIDEIIRQIKQVAKESHPEFQHEAAIVTSNNELRFLAWRHAPLYNHQTRTTQVLSIAVDISGRVQAETELAWLAKHDSMTGLYNRHSFEEELKICFNTGYSIEHSFGVMFIDLDDFKQINDTYGHQKGDEMLQAVADVLKNSSRENDFAARMGGDEFALILNNFHNFDLNRIAGRLMKKLTAIQLGPDITCSASIGIALHTNDTKSVAQLVANADVAMYKAKQQGKNQFVIYDNDTPSMQENNE